MVTNTPSCTGTAEGGKLEGTRTRQIGKVLVEIWTALSEDVTTAFQSISMIEDPYPTWFTEGKTRLIPKLG